MIRCQDHKSGYLFDPWEHLGPKRRQLLEESWAGLFRQHILSVLPVQELARFYDDSRGRPTKELYTLMGAVILQQMHDLTDQDTVSQIAFNEQWHYALDIAAESDDAKYVCPKTLFSARQALVQNNLGAAVFDPITQKLAEIFKVDPARQRLDSVAVKSNMSRLGRIRLIAAVARKFLVNLKRRHEGLFAALRPELTDRYLKEAAFPCFSLCKPSESERTLAAAAQDLFDLVQFFEGQAEVAEMYSYKLLTRVLSEQCKVVEGADGSKQVAVRPPKEVPCDSLQNPSDPDAGYDAHKGQGYHVQVMEAYCDSADAKARQETLNLITHVAVEPAGRHDANALLPALESAAERGLGPEQVLADSAYGGLDNVDAAAAKGVEVVSPAMGQCGEDGRALEDFSYSDEYEVVACPQGHAPETTYHQEERHSAQFSAQHCSTCPRRESCPTKPGAKGRRFLRYNHNAVRCALRRVQERTAEFKSRYRWRSGIEACMSALARRTGIKRLRVRGIRAVRFGATLKVLGLNLFRASALRRARIGAGSWLCGKKSAFTKAISVIKELFRRPENETIFFRAVPLKNFSG